MSPSRRVGRRRVNVAKYRETTVCAERQVLSSRSIADLYPTTQHRNQTEANLWQQTTQRSPPTRTLSKISSGSKRPSMGIGTASRFILLTFKINLENIAASTFPRRRRRNLMHLQTASDLPRSGRSFLFFPLYLVFIPYSFPKSCALISKSSASSPIQGE